MSTIYCTVRKEGNSYIIAYKQDNQLICFSPKEGHSLCQEEYVRQLQKMCDNAANIVLSNYNDYAHVRGDRNKYVLDHKLALTPRK